MSEVKKQTTVFEFGYLGNDDEISVKAQASPKIQPISGNAYRYLRKLCLCDDSESRFMRLGQVDNCEVLQVKNYAGVIFTPDGTQIEVLPKVAKNSDESTSRASLLMMLKSLKQFRHLQTNNANLAENKISQMKEAALKEIKDASIKIAVDSVKKIITTSVDKSKLDAVFQKNLDETKEELKKINS